MKNLFAELQQKQDAASSKLKELIALCLLGIISLTMCVTVWSIFKGPDLTYAGLPWEIVGEERTFHPGQIVPLKVQRCNHTSQPIIYTVTRGVKNLDTGVTQVLASTEVSADPGCKAAVSQLHALPKDMQPGTYIITGIGTIPDLMNSKTIAFQSQPFKVE